MESTYTEILAMDIEKIKNLLDNTKDYVSHSANTLEQVCNLKSVNGILQESAETIKKIASQIKDIDEYRMTRIISAINQARRSLDATLKSYLYPKMDGPRCQETAYDDGLPGIRYVSCHAYYTADAAERVAKKFHTKWRLPKPSDIVDVPTRENLLGTWALQKDGTLGMLIEYEGRVQVTSVNGDPQLRVILINKTMPVGSL